MGDLRNVLNGLKSSTTDSVPQNVEESWYDDKDSNEACNEVSSLYMARGCWV